MNRIKINLSQFTAVIGSILFLFLAGSLLFHNPSFPVWGGAVAFLCILLYFLRRTQGKEAFCDKIYPYCLIGFVILFGILQFSRIEELRFQPSFDLDAIYGGAIQWLETGSFPDYYDYFDWFPNNLGGLTFLYVLFRIGTVFSGDYFLIAAYGNGLLLLLALVITSLTARKVFGSRHGLLTLLVSVCFLPFSFMADAFYTDSLSLLFPVLLFYLSLFTDVPDRKKKVSIYLLSGFAATIGIFVKPTVGIMVIAIVLSFLFQKKWRKAGGYVLAVGLIYLVFSLIFHNYMYSVHLDPGLAAMKNTPSLHWIMMGLTGNGGYNPADYEFTRSFRNPALRNQALWSEIGNRISENGVTGMLALYARKLYCCFGDGTLALSDFLDDSPVHSSWLHSFILYSGEKYHSYQTVCNMVFYALLLLLIIATVSCVRRFASQPSAAADAPMQDPAAALQAPVLASIGITVFLMHWETSARYITNYVPVLLIVSVYGIECLQKSTVLSALKKHIASFTERHPAETKIFCTAICFRIVFYLISVVVMAVMGDYSGGITFSDFLEVWKRWDSQHYLNIAENGYAGAIENGEHIFLVFYPLLPWLLRCLAVFFHDMRFCGILLSTICYGIGCIYLYKIAEKEFDKEVSLTTIAAISVFPFGFFFGSIMTESLFFAIASAFLYYVRQHKWPLVALLGFLACLTKVQGLLLAFAVLVELFYAENGIALLRDKKWKDFLRRVILPGCQAAVMLAGFVVYLLINYQVEGDPFRFLYYQSNHWYNGFAPIWTTLHYIIQNAVTGWYTSTGMSLWVPELVLFFVYIAGIVYGFRRKMRPMYLAYLIVFFLLTYSSSWLISAGRYTLSALPLFLLAGDWLQRHEKRKLPILLLSSMLMMLYFVGYFGWKQIM